MIHKESNGLSEHHNGKIASSPLLLTLRQIRYYPRNVSTPMGALEALNDTMLFGPTTAFLFSVIQAV
jgi:hypothetical protein